MCPNRMVCLLGEEVHAGAMSHGVATSPVHILSIEAKYAIAPFKSFTDAESQSERISKIEEYFDNGDETLPWLNELGREKAIAIVNKTAVRRADYAHCIAPYADSLNIDPDEYAYTIIAGRQAGGGQHRVPQKPNRLCSEKPSYSG